MGQSHKYIITIVVVVVVIVSNPDVDLDGRVSNTGHKQQNLTSQVGGQIVGDDTALELYVDYAATFDCCNLLEHNRVQCRRSFDTVSASVGEPYIAC